MRLRILPLTWMAISTSSSFASAGSYLRPRRAQQVRGFAQHLPQLVRQIGRERRQHQHQSSLSIGHQRQRSRRVSALHAVFVSVHLVHQLHQRGNRRIEVPATGEVFGDALDRLVQLALHLARRRRQRAVGARLPRRVIGPRIASDEAIDAADRKRLMPSTPASCQSRSWSGGPPNSVYMRVESAP